MKFGKEFNSQMVQEWQGAYMDYNSLKKILKEILKFREDHALPVSGALGPTGSFKRRLSMYRAFSGLTSRYNTFRGSPNNKKNEDEVILVHDEDNTSSDYHTRFMRSSDQGGEYEQVFFRRLDDEFKKVVKFYKEKVEEVKEEATELSKQMDALIALRIIVDQPANIHHEQKSCEEVEMTENSSDPAIVFASVDGRKQGHMNAIQEIEMSTENGSDDQPVRLETKSRKPTVRIRPASLKVLDHVKVRVDPNTPVSTMRKFLRNTKSDLTFSKRELKQAEEKLRHAFIDFHHKLRILKSYCFLNTLAFSKIMKKYDKVTSRSASKAYLEMVDRSYLGSSDEVNNIFVRLEAAFIKHFANGNHRKGMKCLKPAHKKEKHRTSFFLGLFLGSAIALVAAIILSIRARHILDNLMTGARNQYMEIIFPLYSLFLYITLHMVMYGANTFFWRKYRVNYPFIFGFKPGTELGFREIFLVASGLAALALAATLSNLDLEMDPHTRSFRTITELVPLLLVIFVFIILVCPFNIVYRSSRYFLLRCTWHCICAPLYKVTLPDFFLADHLTSQIQAIRSLEFYICYYGWGNFRTRDASMCRADKNYNMYDILYIILVIVPFGSRLFQCLRRYYEEKDAMQGLNGLKYLSTIVALVMRSVYETRRGVFWKVIAASTSGFTTVFSTYWDLVLDWGLLQKNSKNPWLRDKLLISHKSVYYVAIVANCFLRLVWMQMILGIQVPFLHRRATTAFIGCLEIFRRGIWSFFRIENEHFNNVGKYRAFKTVPLPFHYES